jgi:hypothetical protein
MTCESFFSLLKRGVMGSFHHVSREHLHRLPVIDFPIVPTEGKLIRMGQKANT